MRCDDDWAMPLGTQPRAPRLRAWPQALADVAAAVAAQKGIAAPLPGTAHDAAAAIAASLLGAERKALLLGNAAAQHPQASQLLALAQWIAEHTGASVGYLGEAANSVGAQLVGALPGAGGLNAGQMLSQGMKALLLLNVEPELDAADPPAARAALQRSGLVVALTAFKDAVVENADVLLPIAPFTETAGSFVNAEGRLQAFTGVVPPLGETRPAWKVLRVLGNLLGLRGFEQDNAEQVRAEAIGDPSALAARLDNRAAALPSSLAAPAGGLRAHRRRADLCRRRAGAPRRIAAADGRRACAGGQPAECAVGRAGPEGRRCGARDHAGPAGRACAAHRCGRRRRAWRPAWCACRPGMPTRRCSARCSALSTSRGAEEAACSSPSINSVCR